MVRTVDCQEMSDNALKKHGLFAKGWRSNFTKASDILAQCRHNEKRLVYSIHYLESVDEHDLKQTILHEVAHALTPGEGHSYIWKEKAEQIGCNNPQPC